MVLDEIPTPRNPGENQAGLTFQMRYSVPLFVYGTGLNTDSARPALRWQQISEGGRRWLQLTNSGSGHARLSNVAVLLLVNHQLQHILLTVAVGLQAGRRGQG